MLTYQGQRAGSRGGLGRIRGWAGIGVQLGKWGDVRTQRGVREGRGCLDEPQRDFCLGQSELSHGRHGLNCDLCTEFCTVLSVILSKMRLKHLGPVRNVRAGSGPAPGTGARCGGFRVSPAALEPTSQSLTRCPLCAARPSLGWDRQ